jgi:aspartyl-tRNA(Asn)/glutamyl-tRNA(Gln) amidotransferase subunit A
VTLDDWARLARAHASKAGLPELEALVDSLVSSTRALRAADWNLSADAQALPPVPRSNPPDGRGSRIAAPSEASGSRSVAQARNRSEAPDDRPVNTWTISELAEALRERRISSREASERCLEAIRRRPEVNAFITVTAELARRQADAADREFAEGQWRGPLHGIPLSLKDLIDLEGSPTTAGSRVRAGIVARHDATATARLKQAGTVIVGKCNMHEFAFGTTSEDSAFGPVHHPAFFDRSPGGSSGGSAAAVASGMCVASIGTDTGGSIRIPASACGLVGFKPTFGHVPCDGVVPLAMSLDHVGPIARTVTDAEYLYRALVGAPATGLDAPRQPFDLGQAALGLTSRYFLDALDHDVRAVFEAALERLERAGIAVVGADVPHAALTSPVYLHTVLAESAAYHARTLELRGGDYTPAVRVRLEMARYVLAEDYVRAQEGRVVLRNEVSAALAGHDALVLPTLPIPAPPLGVSSVDLGGVRDPVRNATLRLTQLFDLTGHPAISIPCGRTKQGLPVGLQLVAAHDATDRLFALAAAIEPVLMFEPR